MIISRLRQFQIPPIRISSCLQSNISIYIICFFKNTFKSFASKIILSPKCFIDIWCTTF
uniref:Uncharacterized protein n=1 Tax=virus sp. ctx9V1 TaxID=2828001 RepID=A0A8S5RD10_9VIRU|nr:MAG TPA: hypothetical protein [virus sp. ctx9V1]DAJ73232.1 MAG TPA: hypothetical protein [Caudoviricetes sp.]